MRTDITKDSGGEIHLIMPPRESHLFLRSLIVNQRLFGSAYQVSGVEH